MIQDVKDQRLSNNRIKCLQAETTSGLTSKPQGGTKETSDGPLKPMDNSSHFFLQDCVPSVCQECLMNCQFKYYSTSISIII